MTETTRRYLRFLLSDRVLHLLLLISFTVLAITGLPQKWPDNRIAVFMIQAMGGIEQTRVFHHTAAVILILTSIAHAVQVGYRMYVQRKPLTMLPTFKDVTDFFHAIRYNLGLTKEPPRYPRYNFIEKVEYWAVVWGTVLMTVTGYVLWNPILVTTYLPGEFVPAAKIAHGMEAILAVLSILLWHFYFVHVAVFNKSIFTGYLSEHEMEEDHATELEQRLTGQVWRPPAPQVSYNRLRLYAPLATLFVVVTVLATWRWLTAEQTAITTVPRVSAEEQAYQPVGLEPLPIAETPTPLPTPPSVLVIATVAGETPAPAAGPPSIPHPITGAQAQCNTCHAVDSALQPAPPDHAAFDETLCTSCHQPGAAPAETDTAETPAAGPPSIPHPITGAQAQCITCHAVDSVVQPAPPDHAAFDDTLCMSCHQPSAVATAEPGAAPAATGTSEAPTPAAGAPTIPHPITAAKCTACHAVDGQVRPAPPDHAAFADTLCVTCHQPGPAATPEPTAAPTATAAAATPPATAPTATGAAATPAPTKVPTATAATTPAPAAGPPTIPHPITGAQAQCSTCHAVGSGMRPAPADHASFADTLCVSCHQQAEGD